MLSNLLADVNQFLPTPSHGGRHPLLLPRAPRGIISTHALTWRATSAGEPPNDRPPDFYPRPHMEGDLSYARIYSSYFPISTHALTWRATQQRESINRTVEFLPTPSHGGRPRRPAHRTQPAHFYPRPHMEGDLRTLPRYAMGTYFYPRPHMEGDLRRQH